MILLALLSAGVLGWYFLKGEGASADAPAAGGDWETVKRYADFEIVCREDGELLPVKVTTIGFTRWGKVEWLIPEGTRVKKGERIVTLETEKLVEEIQQIQDEVSMAERTLAQQEQTRELEVKRLELEMLAEKDRLELAQLKAREILARPTAIEKEEAASLLQGAEARVSAARGDLAAMAPLIEKGFAQRVDVENKELALNLAGNELERSRMGARKLLDGATSEERQRAALDQRMAEIAYQQKELDRDVALGNNNFQVRASEFQLTRVRERLADRKLHLVESSRAAPHDGIVVYRMVGRHSAKKVQVGDHVGPWASPMDLPNYELMKVRTQVPESVVRKLTPRRQNQAEYDSAQGASSVLGSPARVRVKTLPGKVYAAEVTWIDGWARDRNAKLSEADIKSQGHSGVQVFDVEVELKESDPARLREGFQASVEFPFETLHGVVAIPEHAVTVRDGRASVKVISGSRQVERAVQSGPKSSGRVVILSGLEEGERILIPPKPPEQEEPKAAAVAGNAAPPAAGPGGASGAAAPPSSTGNRRGDGSGNPGGPGGSGGSGGPGGSGGSGGPGGPGGGRRR